jgi:hypothetical protein
MTSLRARIFSTTRWTLAIFTLVFFQGGRALEIRQLCLFDVGASIGRVSTCSQLVSPARARGIRIFWAV